MKRYDVLVVGGATIDVFVDTDFADIKINRDGVREEFIAYPEGSKLKINRLFFSTGGGGTNAAAGFSAMGLKAAFLGMIGLDENGDKIVKDLRKDKVDFIGQRSKTYPSGYSIILDSVGHDRTILTHRGANEHFIVNNKTLDNIQPKWIHLASLSGNSLSSLKRISMFSREHNIPFSYNISTYMAKNGLNPIKEIIEGCSVFILNKEEAGYLLQLPENGSEKRMLKELKKKGPSSVVITDGKRGIFALDSSNNYHRVKAHNIKVIEATGAGDAFCAGFLSALVKKLSFSQALKIGLANSESVIQIKGAKNGLLSLNRAKKIVSNKVKST